ncbi:MAG TPA: glycosyltransferase [Acetivibrio sp.]|jgi:uncharacterized protein YyaL (SSP411 family)|nr:glycosyltransferase [Clostridium sp.]HOQ36949.1 glycosyltransferase [Acetivibrio sp.]HPT90939.1 glycosyltransferase [Acetivibrio sp.]
MTEKLYFSKALKDDHIFRLTDDTGMLQHSKYALPDPNHGYTTDDNARALIMALMLYGRFKKKEYLDLVYRYASFLLNAQNDSGKFKNFMGYDRKWLEEEGSEDCFGRCLWALGYALSNDNTPTGVKQGLSSILKNAMPHVTGLNWLRAKAYSIIGLSCLENKDTTRLVFQIAQSLCSQYDEHRDGEWKWFEENVTYCNNVLPWSLLAAYRVTGEKRFWEVAGESLQFLESITFKDGYFKPVGCDGWLPKGGKIAEFDEQTVEACEAVLTYMEAYEITKDKRFLKKAKKCHAWYEGANSKGISLIDSETGGCYDGLTPQGLNLNMGAESLVSYIISYLKISEIE